ncbi:subtilisin-like protein [Epithele typhae]|uniref:subtilisin-like protein n=1 Tax=Epithele typhae TaxID=378194 RepID=UPI002007C83A|nr:subtilisin-like protein [Epithele typhae]KAH9917379.1 subtilisin-like protein [Epithele typhae]
MLLSALLPALLASLALARPPSRRSVHETRRSLPAGWNPVRRANAGDILPLSVGLVQNNLDNLESYLLDVADPGSPNYAQHWTTARVAETFRPSAEAVDAVRAWLEEDGTIAPERIVLSTSGGWLTANVTVAEAEALLGTEYYEYEHARDGRTHLACHGAYSVPAHVASHVDLITPTLHFDAGMRRHGYNTSKNIGTTGFGARPKVGGEVHSIFTELEHCDEVITLACLRALYDFVYIPLATKKNSIGVVEYSPESHLDSDFDVFFGNYSKSQVGKRPIFVGIDGAELTDNEFFAESSLDLQYVMGLVGGKQPVTLYQVGDNVEGGSFNTFLNALDGGNDPNVDPAYPDPFGGYSGPEQCGGAPQTFVVSTSYGYQEAELSLAYTQRQCAEYGKLSLTGMTFVYSSGDAGVSGPFGDCLDENNEENFFNGTRFNPTFPGGCQYVTSVGATQVKPGNKVTDPEVAVFQLFPSGGGFSNHFPRPSFQDAAVSSYLAYHAPDYPAGTFNTTGRAYPDVSANGLNYSVAIDGQLQLVSGTSASAPTFASVLSAINDARLAVGKKPVGWVNPALYKFEGAFNDITEGDNPGCDTDGFSAAKGWDPVTGLGTPNYLKLVASFLLLQ